MSKMLHRRSLFKSHPLSDVPQYWLDHKHLRVSYCIRSYNPWRNLESGKPRRSLNFPSLRRMTGLASHTIITPSCPHPRVFTCVIGEAARVYIFSDAIPPLGMGSCKEGAASHFLTGRFAPPEGPGRGLAACSSYALRYSEDTASQTSQIIHEDTSEARKVLWCSESCQLLQRKSQLN